ncbi:MAG: SusC/RagA family TonB-linked outer membrane protein, partial [Bacteroidales bacterium]|nr:SusC/RagA family TonB-linked outer membrane protein [Bacteroidales bacterium]
FATMFKEARNGSYLYSVPTGSIGDPNSVRPEVYNRIPGVVETYLKDAGHTLTNTDWQDAIFRNAQTTRHAVSVSGKAGSANYYIGANYLYREGTIICSDYQRYSIRANIDGKKGRLKYGISVNPSYSAENYVDSDSQYGSDGVIASALMAPPIFPVKNADGSYNWDMNGYLRKNLGDGVGDTQTNEVLNPVALANEVKDFREKMNILGNAYASFEIIDGLEYRITAGGDYYGYARDYYRPSTIPLKGNKYIELDSDPTMPAIPVLSQPKSRNWSYHYYHWTVSNQLSFNRKWGDHSLRAVAAYEAEKKANRTASIYGDGTIGDDKIKTTKGTTLDIDNTLNNLTNYTFDSWLVRAQYSYKARYMLSASIRGDRSSRFGSNNRLGIFPAASIGWRISDEDFMRDVKAVSDLKLRASVGQTGNANIGNYEWLALYGISNIYMGEGNSIVNQVYPSQIQNADLGWERNTQYNIGVDANLWSGLLGFSVDAYYSRTTDMLFDVPVPAASGFTSSNVNIGSMENKGIEISLNSRKTFPSGFFYEARGNWTLNRNKVLSLGDEDAPIIKNSSYSGAAYITQVGQPVGCYYLLVQDGVFHNQEELDSYPHFETTQIGDFRFIDADGDGILEKDDDRVIVGNYMPDFYYGFGLSMGFKGIDLSADFQGVYGNEILNLERRYLCNIEASSNMMDLSLQRFPYGEINRATRKSTGNNGSCTSTFHIEDGSYLRLQNLALGYTLPKSILRRAKINNLRIYLQGSNLFTLTNYTGYNPEVNKNSSDALRPGEDYCSYPLPRTYTVGVNLNF